MIEMDPETIDFDMACRMTAAWPIDEPLVEVEEKEGGK